MQIPNLLCNTVILYRLLYNTLPSHSVNETYLQLKGNCIMLIAGKTLWQENQVRSLKKGALIKNRGWERTKSGGTRKKLTGKKEGNYRERERTCYGKQKDREKDTERDSTGDTKGEEKERGRKCTCRWGKSIFFFRGASPPNSVFRFLYF